MKWYKKLMFILFLPLLLFSKDIQEIKVTDLKKIRVFKITGLIEIDGHIFLNDTCKVPVMFSCSANKVRIYKKEDDNIVDYKYRQCKKKYCDVLHLEIYIVPYKNKINSFWEFYPKTSGTISVED